MNEGKRRLEPRASSREQAKRKKGPSCGAEFIKRKRREDGAKRGSKKGDETPKLLSVKKRETSGGRGVGKVTM